MDKRTLSVAILGTRGIPNRYGGFEACAEKIGPRLAERGHRVAVYATSDHPFREDHWQGVRIIRARNPERWLGTFGQFIYDYHCNRHSRGENFDIILHLGYTSDSVWYRLWAKHAVHIVNMDGQEWKRAKYNRGVRLFLRYAERLATRRSRWLVADSGEIEKYLREKYAVPVRYIPYGADIPVRYAEQTPGEWGLAAGRYDLVIARMEPENNIEMAIMAKLAATDPIPLVIVGNNNGYKRRLVKKYGHQQQIRFLDAVYDPEKINSLRHFSRIYVHGHSVGGTNPSLLEAMACGCRIVSYHNVFNAWVLGEKAFYYQSPAGLAALFSTFDAGQYEEMIGRNLEKIREEFNWESVTRAYEKLFYDAIGAE